ncbi:MAG: ABC transporter ATP-binding protein [Christensenellales bacterium]
MKKLLIYLKEYRKECILGPIFKMLEAVFELLIPLVMASIIDIGIARGDGGYVLKMCLLIAMLGAVGLTSTIISQYYAAKAAAGFAKKLKHALFTHIQTFSYTELDSLGTSTMITRITSDADQVQIGVNLTLRLLLRSPFIVFGAMIMAFTVDSRAALVFAGVIPVLMAVVFGIMLWCIPLYKKVQAKLDRVLGITRENLAGVRVIRAFCKEEDEIRDFSARNAALEKAQNLVGRISALMNPATYAIINIGIAGLIWIGAIRVEAGLITQGAVVALYNYMSQILIELIKLANLIITITRSIASGNRIQEVLQIRPTMTSQGRELPEKRGEAAVEFRNVSLRYQGAGGNALEGIDFTARRGETIGIIGGTGAGKSSLVNLVPRFYDATEGEVLVDGVNVKDYPLEALRRKIGIVPQKAVLFSGSIRDNLRWGKEDATDEEIMDAVITAQATDVVNSKGGLDYRIEQGGKNLSGGQRQRLTIARALIRKPDILILDDSASALDFVTDAALRKALREMEGAPTVFIVSQRASSIQHADQIIVLEDGCVAGIGTSDALLETCEVYREIYESQFKKEGKADVG